jgi:hypothetical protein
MQHRALRCPSAIQSKAREEAPAPSDTSVRQFVCQASRTNVKPTTRFAAESIYLTLTVRRTSFLYSWISKINFRGDNEELNCERLFAFVKFGIAPMTDTTQALCFVLLVICLGSCLIRAFWEIESARQRRRERNQFVRHTTRTVVPVTKRGGWSCQRGAAEALFGNLRLAQTEHHIDAYSDYNTDLQNVVVLGMGEGAWSDWSPLLCSPWLSQRRRGPCRLRRFTSRMVW